MNTTFTKPKRQTNKKLVFILLLFFLSTAFSCKEDPPVIPPPPPDLRKLTLTIEDASCTEVWIKIKADSIALPAEIKLMQNADEQSITLTTRDSIFYIDTLTPNQTYNYQAVLNTDTTIKSETITAQTLEATSHNFTWQTFEFGEPLTGNSSVLYDVAIIDENNIWAVGEIYMNDSLGNTLRYNAVNWNGIQWELKRIRYYGNCSAVEYPVLKAIWAYLAGDIIITNGGSIGWFNGTTVNLDCRVNPLLTGAINKIWGSSSNDLYVVGNSGNIVHYNGSQWTKIESGTTLTLIKVHGNSSGDVYASGGSYSTSESVVLKLNGIQPAEKIIDGYSDSQVDTSKLFISQLYGIFSGPWVDDRGSVIIGGSFIYRYRNNKWSFLRGVEGNYPGGFPSRGFIHDVSGNSQNDFCIAGEFGSVQHYNGINAVQIGGPFSFQNTTHYYNVDMKGEIIVTVGKKIRVAVITVYRRQ